MYRPVHFTADPPTIGAPATRARGRTSRALSGTGGDAVDFGICRVRCVRMAVLANPFPEARMGACVRVLPWNGRVA